MTGILITYDRGLNLSLQFEYLLKSGYAGCFAMWPRNEQFQELIWTGSNQRVGWPDSKPSTPKCYKTNQTKHTAPLFTPASSTGQYPYPYRCHVASLAHLKKSLCCKILFRIRRGRMSKNQKCGNMIGHQDTAECTKMKTDYNWTPRTH